MYQVGYEPGMPGAGGFPQAGEAAYGTSSAWRPAPADGISGTFWPGPLPAPGGGGPAGDISGFNNVINWLFSTINGWMNSLTSGSGTGTGTGGPQTPGDQPFSSATVSSWGDPHDTFSGTTTAGQSTNGAWDSMSAHADLLDSDSFSGGFGISTTVTQPNAAGVTLNASATVTTQDGTAAVSLANDGTATIVQSGVSTAIAAGQTYALGDGETVTGNANGSVLISEENGAGGSIATTLSLNGSGGVDVNATASNVDLGGYLVTRQDGPLPPGYGNGPLELLDPAAAPPNPGLNPIGYEDFRQPIGP